MNLIIPQIAPWLAVVTLTCVCVWGGLFSSVQVESLVAPFTCKKKGPGAQWKCRLSWKAGESATGSARRRWRNWISRPLLICAGSLTNSSLLCAVEMIEEQPSNYMHSHSWPLWLTSYVTIHRNFPLRLCDKEDSSHRFKPLGTFHTNVLTKCQWVTSLLMHAKHLRLLMWPEAVLLISFSVVLWRNGFPKGSGTSLFCVCPGTVLVGAW